MSSHQFSHGLRKAEDQLEALERELEPLRAFHDEWSQHDLEALLPAEKHVKEESVIPIIKAEERHDTVRELGKKLSAFDESHRALKTERDGTSSMAFKN